MNILIVLMIFMGTIPSVFTMDRQIESLYKSYSQSWGRELTETPVSYLDFSLFWQRVILDVPESFGSSHDHLASILLSAPALKGGVSAYKSMNPEALSMYQTLAATYICQQHWEARPDTAPAPFLAVWGQIHNGRPIDFERYADSYVELLYRNCVSEESTVDRSAFTRQIAHQFQQQHVLNRILDVIEKRIDYNEYLAEKWADLPSDAEKIKFYKDFLGFSHEIKGQTSPQHRSLMDMLSLSFGTSCMQDMRSYQHLLELIKSNKYTHAQIFAQQKMFDHKNKGITPKKLRQNLVSQDGEEGVFLPKIIRLLKLLDSENPLLEEKFFGKNVREIVLHSAQGVNFLDDLNVGLAAAHSKDAMMKVLQGRVFLPTICNVTEEIDELLALHKRVRPKDEHSFALINTKKLEQSLRQMEIIESIVTTDAVINRKVCCQNHMMYMFEFFEWAIPIYKELSQELERLNTLGKPSILKPMPSKPRPTLKSTASETSEADTGALGGQRPMISDELDDDSIVVSEVISSDHTTLPDHYWEQKEESHVDSFWRKWTEIKNQAVDPLPEDQTVTKQKAFAEAFKADKTPDFLRSLNEFQRLFKANIERTRNGFIKIHVPGHPTLKPFFHVPHPRSDIGRDAMWAREIRRFLTDVGL